MNQDTAETGGVIGAASAIVLALWLALRGATASNRRDLRAALKKAEDRADAADTRALYWERKAWALAGEIKAAASRRHSLPPGRDEMPTLDAILDLRGGDPAADRQAAIDDVLRSGLADLRSTPPLAGVAPSTPDPRKRPR